MTDTSDAGIGLPLVWPGIISVDGDIMALAGSHCPECGRFDFPADNLCRDCDTLTNNTSLGHAGRIFSVTTIRTKAPFGLPTPYSVAFVDLDDVPLRLFALMDPDAGEAFIGMPVCLSVKPLGINSQGENCLRPVFGTLDRAG